MTEPKEKQRMVELRVPGKEKPRVLVPTDHAMTFEEAKALAGAYVVIEGDYGGQCYLTAPTKMVHCQEDDLRQLLQDLDEIVWQDVEGQRLYYEQHTPGDNIDSGMGGGVILHDVWIHPQLIELGLEARIRDVISNKLSRLGLSREELDRLREKASRTEEHSKYL